MKSEVEQGVIEKSTWRKRHPNMVGCLILAIIIGISSLSALMIVLYNRNPQIIHVIVSNNETYQEAALLLHAMNDENQDDVCLSMECNLTASRVLENMDVSKHPCVNFYEFACGNFTKNTNIPEDKCSVNSFVTIYDLLQENLRNIIEQPIQPDEPNPFQLTKKLYNSCMNIGRIEENGLNLINNIFKRLGGWPLLDGASWAEESFNWIKSVYNLRELGYSVNYFFTFAVGIDNQNSTNRRIYLDQADLGLYRKVLIKGLDDNIVKAYFDYMVNIAVIFGADRERAETELKESLAFELELAKISLPQEKRRDARALYNQMTIAQLEEKFPSIPWIEYINTLLAPETTVTKDEVVVVQVPSYITDFEALINATPKRVQANYVMWRVVKYSVFYLTETLRKRQFDYLTILIGTTKREPRWKECVYISEDWLSKAVAAQYVKKYFNENAKQSANEMTSDIRSQFYEILKQVDWMDEKTRSSALEKAKSMATYIGYPDELLDNAKLEEYYAGLELDSDDFLSSVLNITLFGRRRSYKSLKQPVNKTDWRNHASAAVVNAFYSPNENSIQFPAGILQGVFFNSDRPRYMNYGAIGSVIGHEITHGFDDQGSQFDKNGNLADWWETQTKSAFLEKAQCIIDQYGNYSVPELGMNLNGIITQGENIADNGGITESYLAYNKWVERNGIEPKLPNLNYTPQQMFWISAANIWCSTIRPETLKLRILNDPHSPAEFRVVGPMSNSEYFAKDFNCAKGSPMNPIKSCKVW